MLLDTDVVSFLIKDDDRAEPYLSILRGHQPALCFMTVAELFQWAEFNHWGERRRAALQTSLDQRFALLGYELGLAKEWARVRAQCRDAGTPISVQDGWVAATARYFELPLLTHNRRHFEPVKGIELPHIAA